MNELLHYDNELDLLFTTKAKTGLDFVLLGMGRDGHVGSIFPENGLISYREVGKHLAVTKLKDDYPINVKDRISMQLHSLVNSKRIGIFLTGSGKCQILEQIHKLANKESISLDDYVDMPVFKLLLNGESKITFYLNKNSLCT